MGREGKRLGDVGDGKVREEGDRPLLNRALRRPRSPPFVK